MKRTQFVLVPALVFALGGGFAFPAAAVAQGEAQPPATEAASDKPKPKDQAKIAFGEATKDLLSPDAPGFVALGVAQNDVVHPESLKRLAVGILNGLDQNGNLQNGMAFQFSPALVFAGDSITSHRYSSSTLVQLVTRFEVMAAATKGSGDDKSARAAIGFTWHPIDTGDPYANDKLLDCFSAIARIPEFQEITDDSDEQGDGKVETGNHAAGAPGSTRSRRDPNSAASGTVKAKPATVAECRKEYYVSPSRAISLQVGFAPVFVSESGKTDEFHSKGYAANAVLAIGIDNILGRPSVNANGKPSSRAGKLILGATYRRQETVPHPTIKDQFVDRDRFNIGGRLLVGSLKRALFGAEVLYQDAKYEGGLGRDKYITYTATVDWKIAENLWLGLAAGGASGNRVTGNEGFVGTRFRWGIGPKAVLAPQF